jgi:hypothetical protein
MAYSGVIAQDVFTATEVIDRAFRLCRLKPQQITSEMQNIALRVMYLQLKHLTNRGLQSWTIQKKLVGLNIGQPIVACPAGTIDVLNANWRSVQRLGGGTAASSSGVANNAFDGDFSTACVATAPDGNISYDFTTATQVTTVGVLFYGAQYLHLVAQVSSDGVTWTTVHDEEPPVGKPATAYADYEWLWFDVARAQQYRYARILETSGGTLAVRELVFGGLPQEIPLARLNRDDYVNLPNKYFPGRPAQYWLDRKAALAEMNVYPVTDSTNQYGHLVLRTKRQIMEVTGMNQEIEMPPRWYDAFCYRMATELANELPEVREDVAINLEGKARSKELEAQTEDRDNSPIYYQPAIAVYTK